ncbi:MAG TPA: AI-2E family transporter, partial [Steroidobacter sp.]|nr:AI-2E family transporter [Steroidobacter sp.]
MEPLTRAVPVRDRFYARSFALATALLLGYAFFRIVQPFLGPLLWAMFIAFLLHPLHVRLTRRYKRRPHTSALLLTVLTLFIVLGPLTALSAAFAAQVGDLLQYAQSTVAGQARANVPSLTEVPWISQTIGWLDAAFGVNVAQVRGWIFEGTRTVLQSLASLGGKVFLGAVGTVVG